MPWEKTSAALGCAFYIPGEDKSVESVFRRADSIMYENKKKIKGDHRGGQIPVEGDAPPKGGKHEETSYQK
jgi:predicted signal transduction protein with EAL and GGDEF domain